MKEIQGVVGRRLRLDAIADGTLGMRKAGDGAQSIKWWQEKEIEKVRAYCLKDVEITKRYSTMRWRTDMLSIASSEKYAR